MNKRLKLRIVLGQKTDNEKGNELMLSNKTNIVNNQIGGKHYE